MRIAITGASGLVGSALRESLHAAGHHTAAISRSSPRTPTDIQWNPARGELDPRSLETFNAVIHLAGENIGQRWTGDVKRQLRESRVRGTDLLARTLTRVEQPPAVLISASAVGIYGNRGDEILNEHSTPGSDFLAELVHDWELAAQPAESAGIRVVNPRFGVVLSPDGGALKRMLLPFRLGVGGRTGSGEQWMSWLDQRDLTAMIHFLLQSGISGAVNAVSPNPVQNVEFTATLGSVLNRPSLLPTPAAALRLLFGEMADFTLLASQRAIPARLLEAGFRFRHANLRQSLDELLKQR